MTTLAKPVDTIGFSERLRARAIDLPGRRVLVSRLAGSDQEPDLTAPTNCSGFGRVRHFRQAVSPGWPTNPLPIAPACKALGIAPLPPVMEAQVFQNAACAWRCWYCFVPYDLLKANPRRSAWVSAEELVELYRTESDRPLILDLSGGSPDLVPEWTAWMMTALEAAGLAESTYLWTDDNLSTTYLFDNLSGADLDRVRGYRNYGRVCCFKGFDPRSFAFNTRAAEADFARQFTIMGRLLALGIDVYGYVTLTSPCDDHVAASISEFVDRLQALDPNLPLRVIPLQVRLFTPVNGRMSPSRERSMAVQEEAIAAWTAELDHRFDPAIRAASITAVPLGTWNVP